MRMYVSASWRFGGLGGEMCILRFVSGNFYPGDFQERPFDRKSRWVQICSRRGGRWKVSDASQEQRAGLSEPQQL